MSTIPMRHIGETPDEYRFLLLKVEKLSVAIHTVTGHLSAREPLREELRRMSLRLVEDVRSLVHGESDTLLSETLHLVKGADAIISSLYVAKSAKMIGPGNASVLEREYLELGNFLTKHHLEAEKLSTVAPHRVEVADHEKPALKNSYIRHSADKGHRVSNKKGSARIVSSGQSSGGSRRESILNIIQGKNSYSLGDVAAQIQGVSEKTIQRDLLGLVAEKVLKKTGERRWSRYSRA